MEEEDVAGHAPGHRGAGHVARENGSVTTAQSARWLEKLERLDTEGAYFFCVNRFIFSAVKA